MRWAAGIMAGVVLVLLALGLVMLMSASSVQGQALFGNSFYFLTRQMIWIGLGLMAAFVASQIDYRRWQNWLLPLLGISLLLLVLVLIPGIGTKINGSRRWLRLFGLTFQPSELAKLVVVIFMAWWMARMRRRATSFWRGLLQPMMVAGAAMGLVFIEPDYGTTMLIGMTSLIILYAGGTRMSHLFLTGTLGAAAFITAISLDKERTLRIIAFLDPEKYAQNESYQLVNSLYAFTIGGGGGVGLGQSVQKHLYLPEAHTDFILAIMGEEFGLVGTALIAVLFLLLFGSTLWISLRAADPFGRLLGIGITFTLTCQAIINVGVVTGCLPTKGMALPFISYGGSSLMMSLIMVGILLNIAWHSANQGDRVVRGIKDRWSKI